jgi:hypothetical protein
MLAWRASPDYQQVSWAPWIPHPSPYPSGFESLSVLIYHTELEYIIPCLKSVLTLQFQNKRWKWAITIYLHNLDPMNKTRTFYPNINTLSQDSWFSLISWLWGIYFGWRNRKNGIPCLGSESGPGPFKWSVRQLCFLLCSCVPQGDKTLAHNGLPGI